MGRAPLQRAGISPQNAIGHALGGIENCRFRNRRLQNPARLRFGHRRGRSGQTHGRTSAIILSDLHQILKTDRAIATEAALSAGLVDTAVCCV